MPRRAMNRCSRFKAIPRLSSPDRECFGFFRCGQLSWTGRCVACTVSPPEPQARESGRGTLGRRTHTFAVLLGPALAMPRRVMGAPKSMDRHHSAACVPIKRSP